MVLDRMLYINSRKIFPPYKSWNVLNRMSFYNCFTNKNKDHSICYYFTTALNIVQKQIAG